MDVVERFGATVDVSVTASERGLFFIRRHSSVDHAVFRQTMTGAVGGSEYLHLDSSTGFVVLATTYETAQALRTDPMVDHVGGVTVDLDRLPAPIVEVRDETDSRE